MTKTIKAKPGTKFGMPGKKATGHGPVFNIRMRAGMTQGALSTSTQVPLITIRRAEKDGDYPQKYAHVMAILRFAKERNIEEPNII